jgi:hypothetical protein
MNMDAATGDLTAWVGVVGVVAGVFSSAGVSLLQGAAEARKAQKRDLIGAIDDLHSAATAIYMLLAAVSDVRTPNGKPEVVAILPLAEATSASLARLNKAGATVRRLGPPDLVAAATALLGELTTLASGMVMGAGSDPNAAGQANGAFIAAVKASGY